jgi:HD-like signal output (HDOD) protein
MHVLLLSSAGYTQVYSSNKGLSAIAHACRLVHDHLRGRSIEAAKHETDLEDLYGQVILHRWSIPNDFVVEIARHEVITE